MYVACSTLCFARYPLEQALRFMVELEFAKVDVVINEHGPHLRPSEVAADVSRAAQLIRIGPSLAPAAFSAEFQTTTQLEFHQQLRALCHLARVSNVATLTISAAAADSSLDAETERLTELVRIAASEGVILCVASRIGTLTELPATALALCQRVAGLGLTLDPSAFIAGPNQANNFEQVYPYVRHVRLRDTGRGQSQFQVRIGQGEVEYGRIVSQLTRHRYDRILTVAIEDQADAPYEMEHEVRKLKFLLESLV